MSNPGFLLAEDAALKARLLNGLSVSDDRQNSRKVQVFYRYPESDTERSFPFVTIELIGISHARYRQESELTYYYVSPEFSASVPLSSSSNKIDYFPSEYVDADMENIVGDSPYLATQQMIPIDLTYQISTYCRSQRHDRDLTAGMLRYVFPFRRSYITIPEDNTSRRCDLLSWRSSDVMDQEAGYKKRIFRKVYTVQINSELPQSDLFAAEAAFEIQGSLAYGSVSDTIW